MDRVEPPAAAYYEVARMLGDDYFASPPPSIGVEFTVEGRDGKPTVWCLAEQVAVRLRQIVYRSPFLHERGFVHYIGR